MSRFIYTVGQMKGGDVFGKMSRTCTYGEGIQAADNPLHFDLTLYNKANDYVVLTLGSESWCQSFLHDVYYRAFRLGPDPEARPLVDGADWARIDDDPPIHGSVTVNDVLVEFTAADSPLDTKRCDTIESTTIKRRASTCSPLDRRISCVSG